MLIANTSYSIKTMKSPPSYRGTELINILNDLFQSLGVEISLNEVSEELNKQKETTNRFQSQKQKSITYKMVKFSFSSPQNPSVWRDILIKFSGLIINNIKYDSVRGIWHYEGAIYVM